ncbi:MAG: hypothetical protein AB1807_13185 [Pseudomonadota bacterium]
MQFDIKISKSNFQQLLLIPAILLLTACATPKQESIVDLSLPGFVRTPENLRVIDSRADKSLYLVHFVKDQSIPWKLNTVPGIEIALTRHIGAEGSERIKGKQVLVAIESVELKAEVRAFTSAIPQGCQIESRVTVDGIVAPRLVSTFVPSDGTIWSTTPTQGRQILHGCLKAHAREIALTVGQ